MSEFQQYAKVKVGLMQVMECEVLYRPETAEVKFLPEGPYQLPDGNLSFVGIQHGAAAESGSINIVNLTNRTAQRFDLPGRPGFAFPTDQQGVFVAGVEREVGYFDTADGSWRPFIRDVDAAVDNTIINDGMVFDGNLIFGCKDLSFSTKKAGLYFWRRSDAALIRLRDDQICSNGKAVVRDSDGRLTLIDIDTPSKQITRYRLDPDAGTVAAPETVVDLTSEDVFPDGMILTPDHQSLIVALYDPGDPTAGAARQYCLHSGELQCAWSCPGSPRVTCPQLVRHQDRIRLVLTTAVEHMPVDQQQRHPNAGCLFIGDTSFESTGDQPLFPLA